MILRETESKKSHAVPVRLVHPYRPDRAYYLKHFISLVHDFISKRFFDLYRNLLLVFSLEPMEFKSITKYIVPGLSSASALFLGNYFLNQISEHSFGNSEYAFIYKFIFGTAFLSYCAFNRVTDKPFASANAFNLAIVIEIMAIYYMYSALFNGTRYALQEILADEYALISSLAVSAILAPTLIAYLAKNIQNHLVHQEHNRGAQRSNTVVISSGLTSVSNLYFQINYFISQELLISSRIFQLGLISHNILHADTAMQKFRNLPALLVDLTPSILKKIRQQHEKLSHDFQYNNEEHQVLRFDEKGSHFTRIPRYQLRTGDLVQCEENFSNFTPIAGEIISLIPDAKDPERYTQTLQRQKFSINLKAQTGEDRRIEQESKSDFKSHYKKVDLHAVRDGKQAAVLVGSKFYPNGKSNFFIQVMQEKELTLSNDYEKKSVIDEIIAARKKKNVYYSIFGSLLLSPFIQRNLFSVPAETLKLMFTVFQTMIPFSEAFLRETINSNLVKKINNHLGDQPLETIDALRIVDLCNALGGYYNDSFSKGVAIISDKTGTLTSTQMDVVGLWTDEMLPSQYATEEKLLPNETQCLESFKVFCSAYTNNKKEQEPEEHAILEFFKKSLESDPRLEVNTLGNNHLQKIIHLGDEVQNLETYHLGLYRKFGGRLTLVKENSTYNLVFCGIPKKHAFNETSLLNAYTKMEVRTGVLSRDWCLAKAPLTEEEFSTLHHHFNTDDKEEIEQFLFSHPNVLQHFQYHGTFLINNPVKKSAEHIIGHCQEISVPVFVATGDTTEAAKNIAAILCQASAEQIYLINTKEREITLSLSAYKAVIFAGINDDVLSVFQEIMHQDSKERPAVIFAEMSTEDKGKLARHLKENHYFVVANGDGSNDIMMMKMANMVIAHQSDDGTFAPGVEALANLSEEQLKRLFHSTKSFYELFDIHLAQSLFLQYFAPLANSQEKPSLVLALKSVKMTFELAKVFGKEVKEMNQQHWYSVAFDLLWLWISSYEIDKSSDLPLDNQNILASHLVSTSMGIALAVAVLQAASNYLLFNEATNLTCMLSMLILLPFLLKSIFLGFKSVQEQMYPQSNSEDERTTSFLKAPIQSGLFRPQQAIDTEKEKEPLVHHEEVLTGC